MKRILNLVVILSLVTVGVFGIWTSASAFFFGEVNATAYWTSGFSWTIDKSVTPDTWDLFCGDSGTSKYTIAVTKQSVSEAAWIDGVVHIQNTIVDPSAPTVGLAIVVNVYDGVLPGGVLIGTINVDVSSNPILDYLEDGYYPYHFDIPSANIHASGTYTVEAAYTILNFPGHPGVPWDDIVYSTATLPASPVATNGTINVDDTNGGSWAFSDSGSVSYSKTFTCCADEDTYDNTATIRGTDQSDDASVTVNCYALEVTKGAQPSLKRTYTWDIDKIADQSAVTLAVGEQIQVNYEVRVNVTSVTDSDWAVQGDISVHNPAPMAARINSVSDIISGPIAASVSFGVSFPYSLAAGGTLQGTYSASLPNASSRTNTATATLQNYAYDYLLNPTASGTTDFSGTAAINFANAVVTEIDECIAVSDTYAGALGTVCVGQAPKTFRYSRWIGPYSTCGDYTVNNTASFIANDTGATDSDSWTVNVDVPCGGCTLTPGYWKTHSREGPAPYDDAWKFVGASEEDTAFFSSGHTWYQVLWTPKQGNAYYILAFQYIAAKINIWNGASYPSAVNTAITNAESFFSTHTPSSTLSKALCNQVIGYASTLERYNSGLIGPGHCSE